MNKLYAVCSRVFPALSAPRTQEFPEVERVMRLLSLKDVGLSDRASHSRFFQRGVPVGSTVFRSKSFHFALFFLPKGMQIPLHDHPGMYMAISLREYALIVVQGMHVFSLVMSGEVDMFSLRTRQQTGDCLAVESCSYSQKARYI
jgi:hypothetical protein